jgi:adenylylsulfate kinase
MFVPPERVDLRVTPEGSPEYWTEAVMRLLRPIFDARKPTALFLGRYQPFHDGHKALIAAGIARVGQACIAVRDTQGIDAQNPFDFEYVRARIEHGLKEFQGRFVVVSVPNITNVFYGRDVGYTIERIDLDAATEEVSATEARKKLTIR